MEILNGMAVGRMKNPSEIGVTLLLLILLKKDSIDPDINSIFLERTLSGVLKSQPNRTSRTLNADIAP